MRTIAPIIWNLSFLGKRRTIMEVIPEPVRDLWNELELRVMVLLSLTLQIILIHLGSQRKRIPKIWLRIIIWCSYMMADWVATVALGVLSNNQGDTSKNTKGPDNELAAFWAPFLLLHLGGPDTITAYALEDNELWLRHLLGLIVQSGVALYVFLMAWTSNNSTHLSFLTMPVFVAGFIKYGERTWALWSASRDKFIDSMLTAPDPGPNYVKFMEEYSMKKAEGYFVSTSEVIEVPSNMLPDGINSSSSDPDDPSVLGQAYDLFQKFKRLFANLILSFHDRDQSRSFFQSLSWEKAFEVVDIELSFVYDVFYTKAPIVHTRGGYILKSISITCTIFVFLFFLAIEKRRHADVDLIITYILLIGAIVLEIYAVVLLLSSDWTGTWLSKHLKAHHHHHPIFINVISLFQRNPVGSSDSVRNKTGTTQSHPGGGPIQPDPSGSRPGNVFVKKRWSNSMAQFSLIAFCLKEKPVPCLRILKLFRVAEMLEKYWYKRQEQVSPELKKFFFENLKDKIEDVQDKIGDVQALRKCGDRIVLEKYIKNKLDWTTEVEFDQRILLWHIATDLCYYPNNGKPWPGNNMKLDNPKRQMSKCMSDYMLYLLVVCPSMLPIGIGLIRYRDTCAEAMHFFKERGCKTDARDACDMLRKVNTEVLPNKVKGDRSKSVLFDSCRIAKVLLELKDEDKLWKIISEVWLELLSYAASQCQEMYHAQQLRRGGELLTHVWLLMAHLGITHQFQIAQGHARAKLYTQ